jgi:glycolate oxidase iron-sulfur subunit
MRTDLHPELSLLPVVQEADAILRKCVHCGFCNATCPTYQLLGDELDGPRGRIYLIKNMLEDNSLSPKSMTHLDRCLTCRACETTCPSGVEYGRLLDIGREFAGKLATRPPGYRLIARLLRFVVPRQVLFRPLLRTGQFFKPVLPNFISKHIPGINHATGIVRRQTPVSVRGARVRLLSGCVQSAATPNVVQSLARIMNASGVDVEILNEGCCGALDYHLSAHDEAKTRMRRFIDSLVDGLDEVDAIVSSATGCGVTIAEYPEIFQYEPDYAAKARALNEKLVDAVTLVERYAKIELPGKAKVAVHTPCSMQHGLGIDGEIETLLTGYGFKLVPHKEGHLCCGSAGTYSILQPELSEKLRHRKVENLEANKPDVIVTANVGCQLHLAGGAGVKVQHWLELLDEQLA